MESSPSSGAALFGDAVLSGEDAPRGEGVLIAGEISCTLLDVAPAIGASCIMAMLDGRSFVYSDERSADGAIKLEAR